MTLSAYLDLLELLKTDRSSREERRAFALSNVMVKDDPLKQLQAWVRAHQSRLARPRLSERFSSSLYSITLTLVIIAFLLGIFSGIGLLSYNGQAPVNVIYFIAMVVFLPLLTMMLSLVAMVRANRAHSFLVHISPAFWMEKLIALLPSRVNEAFGTLKISPLLANWLVIKRSQQIALFFSLGLFFALLGVVATKDIAFSWSTTLQVSPEGFHALLYDISWPWRSWFPSAVPSLELIENSQYFRLGESVSPAMIDHVSLLGQWWKFLAFATLFYAIVLRFFFYLLASWGLKRAIDTSTMALDGVQELLIEMNEPVISSASAQEERAFVTSNALYTQTVQSLDASYDMVQGWGIPKEQLKVLSESMAVISPKHYEVGGNNTLDDDKDIIHLSHGEVLFFVKAWEPPTMDFVDYLELLLPRIDKVVIAPVGVAKNEYRATQKELNVWARKLTVIKSPKVWLKR